MGRMLIIFLVLFLVLSTMKKSDAWRRRRTGWGRKRDTGIHQQSAAAIASMEEMTGQADLKHDDDNDPDDGGYQQN